jgi:hypothetical protein
VSNCGMVSENHIDHVIHIHLNLYTSFCDFELVMCLFRYVIYIFILIEAALMLVIFLVCFVCNSVKILEYCIL